MKQKSRLIEKSRLDALTDKPVFSVQYHPEASPGPRDSHYLFQRFVDLMNGAKRGSQAS